MKGAMFSKGKKNKKKACAVNAEVGLDVSLGVKDPR